MAKAKINKNVKASLFKYYVGDGLTKLGGGIIGGSIVAINFYLFVLDSNQKIGLNKPYRTLFLFGISCLILGYIIMYTNKDASK
jgi:hypothetical protein